MITSFFMGEFKLSSASSSSVVPSKYLLDELVVDSRSRQHMVQAARLLAEVFTPVSVIVPREHR